MAPPTNTTMATAQLLGAPPVAVTQDLSELPASTEVWYRYIAQPGDGVLGIWFGSSDHPWTNIWGWDYDAYYGEAPAGQPLQLEVSVGVTYYFEVGGFPASPALLEISLVAAPALPIPVGALAINHDIADDVRGPLAILDAATGQVVRFKTAMPAGEFGAMLRNGVVLLTQDDTAQDLFLYDATLTLIAQLEWTDRYVSGPISSNRVDRFYVSDGGWWNEPTHPPRVRTLSSAGVWGLTIWTLPFGATSGAALQGLGVSCDETVLYYVLDGNPNAGTATAGTIEAWDLINDVALGTLVPTLPNYATLGRFSGEIIVLQDESFLIGYYRIPISYPANPAHSLVRHFSRTGTLLHEYDLGEVVINRVTHYPDDDQSFIAWSFPTHPANITIDEGYSQFDRIRISDGAILSTVQVPQFRGRGGGYYRPTDFTTPLGAPTVRFGHPSSCIILALVGAATAPCGGGAHPLPWMEVTIGGTLYRWAAVTIPHGPLKEGRVVRFGALTRRLTDEDGGPQAATITTVLGDTDRFVRTLAFAGALQHALVEYFLADIDDLRAGTAIPWRVFRGRVQSWSADANLTFTLTVEDELTARLTSVDAIDLQVPIRLIDETVHDRTPVDQSKFKAPTPEIYGRLNDSLLNPSWLDGTWECPHVATITPPGDLAMFLVAAQPIRSIDDVFVADITDDPPVDRRKLPDSYLGHRLLVPGYPSWPLIHNWFETTSGRWTVMFARTVVPVYNLAAQGRIPLTINCTGYEDVGDTTGALIENPALALRHWFINRLMQDKTANWAADFALGDYSLFDPVRWDAVAEVCAARGYKVAGVLGHDYAAMSWRDRVAEWCHNFGFDVGTNRDGQIMPVLLDRTLAYDTASRYTPAQILERGCQVEMQADAVENIVPYVYRRNYLTALPQPTPEAGEINWREPFDEVWLAAEEHIDNEASITALGGHPRGERHAQRQEYTLIREGQVATAVAEQRLDLHKLPNGRAVVHFDLVLKDGCALELGDILTLEHWDVPWTAARRCQVRQLDLDLDDLTLGVTVRDVEDLLPSPVVPPALLTPARLNIMRLNASRLAYLGGP